ncbi:MAG: oxidoreductase [Saprospiraceae bacterium]
MPTKKVILLTGASSGIGKATALQLIQEGHTVYGAARRIEKMQDLVDAGGHSLQMDVTKDTDMEKGIAQIIEKEGRIDTLINNAGYAIYGSVEETSIEDARRQFEVNIFGLARMTQLVLPHMREKSSGQIINVSSMGGRIYMPLGAWYHGTKHALEGWSDCLRLEVKPFGIDVVVIRPGAIATEFGEVMLEPMLKRSGDGPYKKITQSMAKSIRDSYEKENASSPPSVIANTISKAVNASKPKTRYTAGKLAKPLVFVRNYLGDRIYDWAINSQFK